MEVMNMKKLFIALAAGLAVTAGAFAAQMEAVIQSVDADSRLVVLEDDSELTVAEGVDLSALEEGAAVMITVDDATNEITEIVVQ
jgi:type 1 fimbria pilin